MCTQSNDGNRYHVFILLAATALTLITDAFTAGTLLLLDLSDGQNTILKIVFLF